MTPLGRVVSSDIALVNWLTSNPVNVANQEANRAVLVHAAGIGFSVLLAWPAVKGCTNK